MLGSCHRAGKDFSHYLPLGQHLLVQWIKSFQNTLLTTCVILFAALASKFSWAYLPSKIGIYQGDTSANDPVNFSIVDLTSALHHSRALIDGNPIRNLACRLASIATIELSPSLLTAQMQVVSPTPPLLVFENVLIAPSTHG